jgi:hypothetical protein
VRPARPAFDCNAMLRSRDRALPIAPEGGEDAALGIVPALYASGSTLGRRGAMAIAMLTYRAAEGKHNAYQTSCNDRNSAHICKILLSSPALAKSPPTKMSVQLPNQM